MASRDNMFHFHQLNFKYTPRQSQAMLFWSGKTYNVFDTLGTQRLFENITFCLCYTFSLQFCCNKVSSLVGKTIDITYLLEVSLRHDTMSYYCHRVISSNNIFDIPWQNFKYALW